MLIDIEKYVRQALPPNHRTPNYISLTTGLFVPVDGVIRDVNDYEYDAQFETGTPGQLGVLEYILQAKVNASIQILDADGVRMDFRVMIPEGLSVSERSVVRQLVERYKLRSKRYELTESIDWGSGSSDPSQGLGWSTAPYIQPVGNVYNLTFGINTSGVYVFKLVNTNTSEIYKDLDAFEATAGVQYNFNVNTAGLYRIVVGGLTGYATAVLVTETMVMPAWLESAYVTWNPIGHDTSFWLNTLNDVDTEILVTRSDGAVIEGKSWMDALWNQNTWISGDREWAVDFSEVFRANGISNGVGGILPELEYKIKVRRSETPGDVFVFTWTAPITAIPSPTLIEIADDTPTLPACTSGPKITSVLYSNQTSLRILFAANMVYNFLWRIKSGSTVVRSGDIDMTIGGVPGPAVFSPSNQPIITYAALSNGSYTLEIEGGSCSSVPDSEPFTISDGEETPEPPVVTGPVTPKIETRGLLEHMNIQIAGSSENWTISDIATNEPVKSGYEYYYQVGNHVLKQSSLLTNYKYESNRPLRIIKTKPKIGLSSLNAYDYDGPDAGDFFSKNTTMAICIIVFNESPD